MDKPLYHVVTYTGPFGYIKPWTAVRDGETFSQQFLTPSIVEGMRIKLGVSGILRHRLQNAGISRQQEQVQAAGWKTKKFRSGKALVRETGVLMRGVMLHPLLSLAFATPADADVAKQDHLCLCRNEDLVFPVEVDGRLVRSMTPAEFDALEGSEMLFEAGPRSIPLGISRYTGQMMRGRLVIRQSTEQ
ncbi:MAG: hypothetical protein AAGI71_14730 [Bacteroidota bacterium]